MQNPRWHVTPEMTAGQATREILRTLLATMRLNEDGLRQGLDPEFLHDYRVALRRTRSALGQIKGVFAGKRFEFFRGELKWLGGLTGGLRDLDVYLLALPGYRAMLPAARRSELDPLEEWLGRQQRTERARVIEGLDSDRYRALIRGWEEFLDSEADVGPKAGRPVTAVATRRIGRARARVLEAGRRIDDDSPITELHALRIDAKKLRYLLEFFAELYGDDDLPRLIKSLKKLQDCLGRLNDLEIQCTALEEIPRRMARRKHAPRPTLAAMELLVGRLREEQAAERNRFGKRFARFERR